MGYAAEVGSFDWGVRKLSGTKKGKKGKCRGSPIQLLLLTSTLSDQAALKGQPRVEENKLIWAMAHPSVYSPWIFPPWYQHVSIKKMVRFAEIRFFMPEIWRTFNHFIAKKSISIWFHWPNGKLFTAFRWMIWRPWNTRVGGEGFQMGWTTSKCFRIVILHIKNANIRNHTSYIGMLFRFETLIVGCIWEVKMGEMLDSLLRNSPGIHLWRCAKLVKFCSNVPSEMAKSKF